MTENTLQMPEIATGRGQRIVLLHTRGPHKGLHQIMGHSDEFEGRTPDAVTEPFDITPGARRGMAGLVRSTPRFLLYKEINTPTDPTNFIDRSKQR